MPGYDGTGPTGSGPRTGRGLGPCGFGFWSRRFGLGRGIGRRSPWASTSKSDQKQALEEYRKSLEEEITSVKDELKNLAGS